MFTSFGIASRTILDLCKEENYEIVFGYDKNRELYLVAIRDTTNKDVFFNMRGLTDIDLSKWTADELENYLLTGKGPDGEVIMYFNNDSM